MAKKVNTALMLLTFYVVVSSDFPLAPSISLLGAVLCTRSLSSLLAKPLLGNLVFFHTAGCECNGQRLNISLHLLSCSSFAIIFIVKNSENRILWRDSVSERRYRQLLVLLRKEAEAPPNE
ncbi:hypothetical protein QWZ16_15090 [Vibrio ostreicida]|uniref:Secreted protein n=1 Tax=Vibrio ostreicida TaxID=526588 RepID=A0ABT8BX80_9VIBR|nr:hypothetical protein [Vibrio ostreicida]MDN3608191.1 hypothetical protein [Vibrio ostreicida]MDN3610965.1 hypothetical protein [Vibrio ostreicida]MDN3611001.1 hypothetical protein [Vibrio ostreicida]